MKIRYRILLGFASILAIFILLGVFVFSEWRAISADVHELDHLFEFTAENAITDIDAILHMELYLEETARYFQQLAQGQSGSDDCLLECFELYDEHLELLHESLNAQKASAEAENDLEHMEHMKHILEDIENLEQTHIELRATAEEMIRLVEQGDLEKAGQRQTEIVEPKLTFMFDNLTNIEASINEEIDESIEKYDHVLHNVEGNISQVETIVLAFFGAGIMFVLVISFLISRAIAAPLAELEKAAIAVEDESFEFDSLSGVTERSDELGHLARVFVNMAKAIFERVQKLKEQVTSLRIEIDQSKSAQQVAEITGTDFFRDLEDRAKDMRDRKK